MLHVRYQQYFRHLYILLVIIGPQHLPSGPLLLLLLIELQTVHENRLYFCNVICGLYRDADAAVWAGKPSSIGLVEVVVVVVPPAPYRPLVGGLVYVQIVVLRRQAVVVHDLVQGVVEVQPMLGPGAVTGTVTRAVTRAVTRTVGHLARLQAAVAPHSAVQVQPGNQRLADVDAFAPVDRVVVHAGEGALQAHGEHQVLLLFGGDTASEEAAGRATPRKCNQVVFLFCFFLQENSEY